MGATNMNWITKHDTVKRTMTHEFEMGFAVVVDWENMQVLTSRNGVLISRADMNEGISLADYERLLLSVEASVEQLKRFENANSDK